MVEYKPDKIELIIWEVMRKNLTPETLAWFEEKLSSESSASSFNTLFSLVPRKVGKATINVDNRETEQMQSVRQGFSIAGWTVDRLCRVGLLIKLNSSDKEQYFRIIDSLFLAAEMNELVALYSSLPVLAHPQLWVKRCSEGIRSNIGTVLEGIMYDNPYPAENLDQPSWNQMVLKAFFTDKQVHRIIGLDSRANSELAYILSDYAHERWAAHRSVNPQLWRLVAGFMDDRLIEDIKKVLAEGEIGEKKAAFLAIHQSGYEPAKALMKGYPDFRTHLGNNTLTWSALAI